jgi:ABC-type nitrate/sulfonate/bicarbonate transport system substrate-binding protein
MPSFLSAQTKPLRELRVPYALGGSTGFFWVAHRSGSFEKHGIKVLPIFMRGGREAVQALISRDVFIEQQGSSGVITASRSNGFGRHRGDGQQARLRFRQRSVN